MDYQVIDLIITTTITALIAGLVGYVFWLKKQETLAKQGIRKELDAVSAELDKLKEKAQGLEERLLEEREIRKIAQDENSDLRKEMLELKSSILKLTELMSELRIDLGVLNYIKERDRPKGR